MPSDVIERVFGSDSERDAFVAEIRTQVQATRVDGTSVADIARQSGVPEGTLGPWLSDKYGGKVENVAFKLQRWLLSREERRAARAVVRPNPGFVMTPTARAFMGLLSHAQHGPDFALMIGDPGLGKTMTMEQYRKANPQTFCITGEPCARTPNALISEVALALGITGYHAPQRQSRFIIERLRDTGALLAVDEAQNWSTEAIDQLRRWHDAAGIGIALIGNAEVVRVVNGGTRAAAFAQLTSRVGVRLMRKKALAADAEALIDAWGVTDAPIVRELTGIAFKPGALRLMTKALRMALTMAAGEDADLTVRHVQLAARQLAVPGAEVAA